MTGSGEHPEKNPRSEDNFVKKVSNEVTGLFNHAVDASGNIIKSVSGEGGLVGKTADTSGNVLKGIVGKGNQVIGATTDKSEELLKGAMHKIHKRDSND